MIKAVTKPLWGVGGTVQAPEGTNFKIATSAKKDTGSATREFDAPVFYALTAITTRCRTTLADTGAELTIACAIRPKIRAASDKQLPPDAPVAPALAWRFKPLRLITITACGL